MKKLIIIIVGVGLVVAMITVVLQAGMDGDTANLFSPEVGQAIKAAICITCEVR